MDARVKPAHDPKQRRHLMAYDLIVIGTGPGGYVCAIRAAQLGLKTAVVEKDKTFGGTCLNVGCIPSKALLHASELFEEAGHGFAKMGIKVSKPALDLATMMKFKAEAVDGNTKGVDFLLKKNKVDAVRGVGRIVAPGKIEVKGEDGKTQTLDTKSIVIATGSDVARLKGIDIDEKRIVSSTGAIALSKVPDKLLVVGAGVIGLELGSVWRRLGAQVTVVEFLDRIVPGIDLDLAKSFQRLLEKQGIAFKLSSKVTAVESSSAKLKARVEPAAGGAAETIDADVVLVAIGRVPYTQGLGLDGAGGLPPLDALVFGNLGVGLAAASAAVINHVLDERIDAQMSRTRRRPLPTGKMSPRAALMFAGVLCVLSMSILVLLVNTLTAVLTFASLIGYAVIYTVWLKRATSQNIVIGGAAGAAPPVLGWAAVTNSVDPNALLLFLIVFVWTPPHFWALAIARRDEYAKVGIPMLPVTHGIAFTRLQVLLYTVLLTAVTIMPFVTGMSGLIYLAAALVLNAMFIFYALQMKLTERAHLPMKVFRFSITYLMWLFAALLADHYLPTTQAIRSSGISFF
jgi:protoheme IX farnesyltransferase